jgi:hypothetical protein
VGQATTVVPSRAERRRSTQAGRLAGAYIHRAGMLVPVRLGLTAAVGGGQNERWACLLLGGWAVDSRAAC